MVIIDKKFPVKLCLVFLLAVFIHPNYLTGNFRNDIAVLELEHEVSLTENVNPICLQAATHELNENITLFGTGIQRYESQTLRTNVVLRGTAKIEPNIKCKMLSDLDETQLCVLESNETCNTISGSALVSTAVDCNTGKPKKQLMGIKIAGYPCVHSKFRIYTNIAAHLNFIENIIWQKHSVKTT